MIDIRKFYIHYDTMQLYNYWPVNKATELPLYNVNNIVMIHSR